MRAYYLQLGRWREFTVTDPPPARLIITERNCCTGTNEVRHLELTGEDRRRGAIYRVTLKKDVKHG